MPSYIDLSHAIEDGIVTYPGLPAPAIDEHLTREASRAHYAPGTEFSIGRITMVGNTGTYLDSPFHRFADGDDLADLSLEQLADLDGVVVRMAGRTPIATSARSCSTGSSCGQGRAVPHRLGSRHLGNAGLRHRAPVPDRRHRRVAGRRRRRPGRHRLAQHRRHGRPGRGRHTPRCSPRAFRSSST